MGQLGSLISSVEGPGNFDRFPVDPDWKIAGHRNDHSVGRNNTDYLIGASRLISNHWFAGHHQIARASKAASYHAQDCLASIIEMCFNPGHSFCLQPSLGRDVVPSFTHPLYRNKMANCLSVYKMDGIRIIFGWRPWKIACYSDFFNPSILCQELILRVWKTPDINTMDICICPVDWIWSSAVRDRFF